MLYVHERAKGRQAQMMRVRATVAALRAVPGQDCGKT